MAITSNMSKKRIGVGFISLFYATVLKVNTLWTKVHIITYSSSHGIKPVVKGLSIVICSINYELQPVVD
jgi:hypothetical protein